MILLDTHSWVWWVLDPARLATGHRRTTTDHEGRGLGVSVFSCWEVAKLVQLDRLSLPLPVAEWIGVALRYPGVQLVNLTPAIAVGSTQLPGEFHRVQPTRSSRSRHARWTSRW